MNKRQKDALVGLTYLGYRTGYYKFDESVFDVKKIDAIRQLIRTRMRKGSERVGSYGLKHRLENQVELKGLPCQGYVSNGECIYAMILEGHIPVEIDGMNATFRVTKKCLMEMPQYPYYDLEGNEYTTFGSGYKIVFKVDAEQYESELKRMSLIREGAYIFGKNQKM